MPCVSVLPLAESAGALFISVGHAVGESMKDPSQTAGCPIDLEKGSTKHILKPVHQCKVVGQVDYSLGSAATSSLTAPCTNRPVNCRHCKQVVASYSMQQHYQDKHHGVEMPADLAALVELKKHEREHVMQKLTKKGKVDNMCPGPHCCPKRQKTSA